MSIKDVIDGLGRAHLIAASGAWVNLLAFTGGGRGGRAHTGDHGDIAGRVLPDGCLEVVAMRNDDMPAELSRIPPPWTAYPSFDGKVQV